MLPISWNCLSRRLVGVPSVPSTGIVTRQFGQQLIHDALSLISYKVSSTTLNSVTESIVYITFPIGAKCDDKKVTVTSDKKRILIS